MQQQHPGFLIYDTVRLFRLCFGARIQDLALSEAQSTAAGMKVLKSMRLGIHQHGFRSTFRDWAAEQTNYERLVIEHALAHQLKDKAEAAYHRATMLPKRVKLMQAWTNYCAVIPSTADNVSPIRGVK